MKTIIIKGGTVLTGGSEFQADVVIRGERIVYVGPDGESCTKNDNQSHGLPAEIIDAAGKYVAPGFIDLHTHGGDGADFGDGTVEAFRKVLAFHGSHGTTLLYPTSMTGSIESLHKAIEAYTAPQWEAGIWKAPISLHPKEEHRILAI